MSQGDVSLKQQKLSSHCYVSIFNFTLGFYSGKVAEESTILCLVRKSDRPGTWTVGYNSEQNIFYILFAA